MRKLHGALIRPVRAPDNQTARVEDRLGEAVELLGGDLLIEWYREQNKIYMTGPAAVVFDGVWKA